MSILKSGILAGAVLVALGPVGAGAYELNLKQAKINLWLQGDFQGAVVHDPTVPGTNTDGNVDWTARFNIEHIFNNGFVFGTRIEYDQDFDIDSDTNARSNGVQRDELYGYLSTPWGRFELGEQDGPADTLSFHAPILGVGQVRGDFSRYASSRARLSPFDTQDAFKAIYLSPPVAGFRFGVSYGPKMKFNVNDLNPRARTIQRNHVELGAQYQTVVGPFSVGISGAYVTANAAPITQRQDISSWSVGSEIRWHRLRIGGAYVKRGDSNSFVGRNEQEGNVGISWFADTWSAGTSYAHITRRGRQRDLIGAGTSIEITRFLILRVDAVYFNETFTSTRPKENGYVLLADFRIHL